MQIACIHCGEPIASGNINLDHLVAKCEKCHGVFRFEVPGEPVRARRPVTLPKNMRVRVEEQSLVAEGGYRDNPIREGSAIFEWRWFSPRYLFMLVWCVFWDGFLVVWYGSAISSGNVVALLFPILHVTAGVVVTYITIAGFVNRTRVSIEHAALTVAHGPLPWRGNRSIVTGDIEQLFCEQHIGSKGGRSYSLNAVLKNGDKVKLVTSLEQPEQALFLENALERHLGIVDRPVAGELL